MSYINPYENKPLDGIDDDLAQWFALGKSMKFMMRETGLAEITIRHRKMNPLLKKAIEEERRRITEANRGAVIAASIDAIRELHKIIKEKEGDKKDKISASKVVLDQRNKDGEVESMLRQLEELKNELLTLQTEIDKLRKQISQFQQKKTVTVLEKIKKDPIQVMLQAGMTPDPWQVQLLRSKGNALVLSGRQVGKSQTSAAIALASALIKPNSLILLASPSLRQSGELLLKIQSLNNSLGRPIPLKRPHDNALKIELSNGSRILALPATEATLRGFSAVDVLILDEAARVEDALFYSVRPFLATSNGRLIAVTTPNGKRGWFYDEWISEEGNWEKIMTKSEDCPRISKEFLAEEKRSLGPRWYAQEYELDFCSPVCQLFAEEDIEAAFKR